MDQVNHQANQRRYLRYDVSHCGMVGGSIPESDGGVHLASLSKGGCAFFAHEADPNLVPPREVICSFFSTEGDEIKDSQFIIGNLIYLKPANFSAGLGFQYGVRFHDEDRQKIEPIIQHLELLAGQGIVNKT